MEADKNFTIKIKAFRAVDDPIRSKKFYNGHRDVLKYFKVEQITSASNDWMTNPDAYVIYAEDICSGVMYGGVRIHKYNSADQLPLERAVGYKDPRVCDVIKEFGKNGTGELCAHWNSREVKGLGVSTILFRAAVSIISQLNMATLFGLSAAHSFYIAEKVGFSIIKTFGENGYFNYPTPEYLAEVGMLFSETLKGAERTDKEIIFSLREKPKQKRIGMGTKGNIDVEYDLII